MTRDEIDGAIAHALHRAMSDRAALDAYPAYFREEFARAGLVVVPKEPTPLVKTLLNAYEDASCPRGEDCHGLPYPCHCENVAWAAMIAAAKGETK